MIKTIKAHIAIAFGWMVFKAGLSLVDLSNHLYKKTGIEEFRMDEEHELNLALDKLADVLL